MFLLNRLWLAFFVTVCYGQNFMVPDVTLEAFTPKGFRASIRAEPGIEMFGFHCNINKDIGDIEPGDYTNDINTPNEKGYLTYYNPDLLLKIGDVVHYWVFVQHKQLGYRKNNLTWTVKELRNEPGTGCPASVTEVSDRTKVCVNVTVFEDDFTGNTLDDTKWILEQYIPDMPDFEFVIYKKDPDVTFVIEKKLCIKPKLIEDEDELKKNIDLTEGCTRDVNGPECKRKLFLLQNPIVSGRLVSKVSFSYGQFEVKARLPTGDWIYPEIYLEDDNHRRILIAYARGNKVLKGSDGTDIGGSLLFGGPVINHNEPQRSSGLSSFRSTKGPLGQTSHVYKLKWTPDQMELYVDGQNYGLVKTEPYKAAGFGGKDPTKVRLVLGVGVGGISDFPNDFVSANYVKPWKNKNTAQIKKFYSSKDNWYETWDDQSRQLQVEYVKVTAI